MFSTNTIFEDIAATDSAFIEDEAKRMAEFQRRSGKSTETLTDPATDQYLRQRRDFERRVAPVTQELAFHVHRAGTTLY